MIRTVSLGKYMYLPACSLEKPLMGVIEIDIFMDMWLKGVLALAGTLATWCELFDLEC